MDISFRRLSAFETTPLIHFLTSDDWPFHAVREVDPETAGRWITEGRFEGEGNRSFWVVDGGVAVGLVRLMDLGDATPLFDLRLRAADRGRGIGSAVVAWLTRYLFEEFPDVRRIEGTTRQDNRPMRRVFLRCGYAKEAHYRDAWPSPDGEVHDAVGYAVLRRDWLSGEVTAPQWNDELLE
ncbi:GNAT family N-acetyltransferase [Streptomyces sp. NPDC060030]|uniref:GNAT family N-acetyltransferase n=1 Tax=Streptomyces sp. NPDC060030 TaxID=3347042 RepID=UPI003683D838